MTGDSRTTALGLFNYAHSYWASAVALNYAAREVSHPDAPVRFLYYHAVELYLKAFLRMSGASVKDVKDIGHRVVRLYNVAVEKGLPQDAETSIAAALIDADYMSSRYISTGAFTRASNQALWGVCCFLHMEIEPLMNVQAKHRRERIIPFLPDDAE